MTVVAVTVFVVLAITNEVVFVTGVPELPSVVNPLAVSTSMTIATPRLPCVAGC